MPIYVDDFDGHIIQLSSWLSFPQFKQKQIKLDFSDFYIEKQNKIFFIKLGNYIVLNFVIIFAQYEEYVRNSLYINIIIVQFDVKKYYC